MITSKEVICKPNDYCFLHTHKYNSRCKIIVIICGNSTEYHCIPHGRYAFRFIEAEQEEYYIKKERGGQYE